MSMQYILYISPVATFMNLSAIGEYGMNLYQKRNKLNYPVHRKFPPFFIISSSQDYGNTYYRKM